MICRLGAFIIAFPFLGADIIPARFKVFLSIGLAFALTPCLGDAWAGVPMFKEFNILKLSLMIVSEAVLGASISLFVLALTEVFTYAGAVMDMEIGFNASSEFDPSGEPRSILAYLLVQIFIMVFLVSDMHLEIIRIAASSFQTLPPGAFVIDGEILETVIKAVAAIFLVGIQIALPVMATMFLINLGMGILSRIGEDFPVMMLSFALHLGVGLLILGAVMPTTLELCRSYGLKILDGLLIFVAER